MKNINFLIIGSNFYNKGAQLMLLSLIDQIKGQFSNATMVVSPLMGKPSDLKQLGLKLLDFPLQHVGGGKYFVRNIKFGKVIKLLKKDFSGEIRLKDVDVILDISGFAYGDQWGATPAKNLMMLTEKIGDTKTKLILLPQAFGPFSPPDAQQAIKNVLAKANLIFARDKISLSHLTNLNSNDKGNIKLAPDITLTYKQQEYQPEDYCCIVPNERMLDKGSKDWTEEIYLDIISQVTNKVLDDTNCSVFILVHDNSGGDKVLAKKLADQYDKQENVKLVQEEDASKLKAIIGKSRFIVGSRFHALASCLSSSVPCLAISWSHKYQMLFDDFGMGEFVFEKPNNTILDRLDQLINAQTNREFRALLSNKNKVIKQQGDEMWQLIKDVVHE